MTLNEPEHEQNWLSRDREQLEAHLAKSMAQVERGEVIPGDQLLEVLATRRLNRKAEQKNSRDES